MERTYNARVLGEFDFDPRFLAEPNIILWLFKEDVKLNDEYMKLFDIYRTLQNIIRDNERRDEEDLFRNRLNILGYLAERPSMKPSYIKRMIRDLMDVQRELGVWSAYIVCKEFRNELKKGFDREKANASTANNKDMLLYELADGYLSFCEQLYSTTIEKLEQISKDNVMINLSSCKLLRLLDIIHCYIERNPDFTILVFVDRVISSFAISRFLQELSSTDRFSYLKVNFFVGVNNDYQNFSFIKETIKNFKHTIKDFKDGQLNLLCTTAVLEEGKS